MNEQRKNPKGESKNGYSGLTEVQFTPQDRILIFAPHPDDEVLGCGGIIQSALKMRLPINLVFFTYGDSNKWSFVLYRKRPISLPKNFRNIGLIRYKETIKSAKILGLSPQQLIFLGYPDFGTLKIWNAYWDRELSFRSTLTGASAVSYENAFRTGAPYKGEEILRDIKVIINEFQPTKVFIPHPADHSPDHQALYLFTRVALWDLEKNIEPEVYPYLVHYKEWPAPRGYHKDESLKAPTAMEQQILWQVHYLKSEEVELNHKALKAHRSQYISNAKHLLSFVRNNELFGDFPTIELHPGKVLQFSYNQTEEFKNATEEPVGSGNKVSVGIKKKFIKVGENSLAFFVKLPRFLGKETGISIYAFGRRADQPFSNKPKLHIKFGERMFVGIETEFIKLKDKSLVFSVKLSRSLTKETEVAICVFGYRADQPFLNMPKLHIKFSEFGHTVTDRNHLLPPDTVQVIRETRQLTLEVPLKALGNPQKIFTSVRTYLVGDIPLDWFPWRIMEINI
ncbi:MAG: PIG-L deacetylase family protein [Candidatus Ratteibacteria bacterium]|jgi:LmbE family N-acetylglucosaminyl deacetylase